MGNDARGVRVLSERDLTVEWLWLQDALGVKARVDMILDYFESPGEVRRAGEREWRLSGIFTGKQIERMEKASFDRAKRIEEICFRNNWRIVTPNDEVYPSLLKRLDDRPLALFADGELQKSGEYVALAVVGSRSASQYGKTVAYGFCKQFAQAGALTVSGGALGIDSAAHRGAIDGGGKTIAFLGCGLGTDYLRANEELRLRITENGAVVTEFPPYTQPNRYSFPIRNRLISGMCHGTVVIEAGERSGSLITARYAAEQGRDVFAVPGDIVSSSCTGANKLIHDGAQAVFSGIDVLEEYKYLYPDSIDLSRVGEMDLHNHTHADSAGAKMKSKPKSRPLNKDKKLPTTEKSYKAPPENEASAKFMNCFSKRVYYILMKLPRSLIKKRMKFPPM